MTREKLPTRRPNFTTNVIHILTSGKEQPIVVTFGLDLLNLRVCEVFCDSAKSGTDVQALLSDTSVFMSHLLQRGCDIEELYSMCSSPGSVFASIAEAGTKVQRELRGD